MRLKKQERRACYNHRYRNETRNAQVGHQQDSLIVLRKHTASQHSQPAATLKPAHNRLSRHLAQRMSGRLGHDSDPNFEEALAG